MKENYTTLQQKETEVNAKKNEYEKKLELGKKNTNKAELLCIISFSSANKSYDNVNNLINVSAEAETVTARNDLKLALKRVEDLQQAINGELDSDLDSLAR